MLETRHSVCALDCPDACGLLVQVQDGRGTKLRGNPEHPVTRGFLCAKVTKYLDREYSPDRLLYPMKRAGAKGEGKFTRITWDEALDTVAARLQRESLPHFEARLRIRPSCRNARRGQLARRDRKPREASGEGIFQMYRWVWDVSSPQTLL